MTNHLKKFMDSITNENFTMDYLQLVYVKDNEEVFRLNDNLWIHATSQPTVFVNDKNIYFNLDVLQTPTYLKEIYLEKIKEFEQTFNKYLTLYNQFQDENVDLSMYLKICYNIESEIYTFSLNYSKYLFYTLKNKKDPSYLFYQVIRNAMRTDPESIMVGEMKLSAPMILHENNNMYSNVKIIPNNENIIYSSNNEPFNNMFTTINGLYTENEMFTAIQSYLDLTENDDCNILDPAFIENKEHLKNLLNICKMREI
jgi:hypothetical protein